ncbi:MAG: 4-oxalocrotonate tautomerase [Alphaproteobacteria bacterium]|nr:MAG: 4-oxalocrotonate tautomerase [Alphaproteobacteria bacterium]
MPTYSVFSVEGCLDAAKRAKIASEITRIHSKTTGAPTYFAQVIFTDVASDCYFVGGSPLKGHQVFVNGQIRAGRSAESKDQLIARITAAVAEASNRGKRNVWVYITDLIPRQMVEFGHVLPGAGDEARWAAALPEADRAHMQSFALQP